MVPWAPCPRTSTLGTPPPPPSYECGFLGVGGSSARRCSRASAPRLLERRRSTAELLPHYRIGGAHHGVVVASVGAGAGAAGGQAGLPLEHLQSGCLPLDLAILRAMLQRHEQVAAEATAARAATSQSAVGFSQGGSAVLGVSAVLGGSATSASRRRASFPTGRTGAPLPRGQSKWLIEKPVRDRL